MGEGKGLADRVVRYIINCKPLDFACLNVNEIARRFGVSVPHLSRTFKTAKGNGIAGIYLQGKDQLQPVSSAAG